MTVRSQDELDGFKLSGHRNPAHSVRANREAGDAVSDAIAIREGVNPGVRVTREESFFLGTSRLERRLDVLVDGPRRIGFESKVGRTGLDRRTRQELARDVRLLRTGQVDSIVWEFSRSGVTGRIGPSKELLGRLRKFEKLGIKIKVN